MAAAGGCAFNREFRAPDVTTDTTPAKDIATVTPGTSGEIDLGSALGISPTTFMVRSVRPMGGTLPDVVVRNLSVTESGLQDALQLLLSGTGLGLQIEGGPRAFERHGPVTLQGLGGSLTQVIDRLAGAFGFYWTVEDNVVVVEPDRQFVVELPPVLAEDSLAGMTNILQTLGAKDVFLDRIGRGLALRANSRALKQIEQYLERVRETRSMVVYEMQVYQVDLSDTSQRGLDWGRLGASSLDRAKPIGATTPTAATSSDATVASDLAKAIAITPSAGGLGVVIRGPTFDLDALVQFLKTQGTVKTVSQPRLAMMTGAKGMLRVGQSDTVVSRVGSSLSSGVSQVTAETRDIRTGLELSLVAEESDRTIYTRVSLSLSQVLQLKERSVLGTNLTLPQIADRDLETVIRMPPGYSAVLGGITVNRGASQRDIGAATNLATTDVTQSEFVIVLKPTIIRFSGRATATLPTGRAN
jgi:MSHA biogenesis protein MshL